MSTNINQLPETELKALGYDQILIIEQARQNLSIIQAELARRQEAQNGTPQN